MGPPGLFLLHRDPKAQPALDLTGSALSSAQYDRLLRALRRLLEKRRRREEEAVGRELVRTYQAVGSRLLTQKLAGKAGYGAAVIARLADDLHVVRVGCDAALTADGDARQTIRGS